MSTTAPIAHPADIDATILRQAIQQEYKEVAEKPDKGFHFHTGQTLTKIVGYRDEWLEGLSETAIESFAGTGNPFAMGRPRPGENVVDIGSGGGIDSLIAARMIAPTGRVIGIDMTPEMLERARRAAGESGIDNVEFRQAFMEQLPIRDGWADRIISNGVLNLTPDKTKALEEMFRILKPGGCLQIADILVSRAVPDAAKKEIALWTG